MSDINKRPPPDWDKVEQKMWMENADNVPSQVARGQDGMMRRIRTYSQRFGYEVKSVIAKIRGDKMFAATFSKNPTKQGMHEQMAADYLQVDNNINKFKVLAKSGISAVFIGEKGGIIFDGTNPGGAYDSKSLDFYWETAGYSCYASHKYTHEGGGSQNHQFKEQKQFLKNFNKNTDTSIIFFVICDGAYYDEEKMRELRKETRKEKPVSFALHIEDVAEVLDSIVSPEYNKT